MTFKTGVTMTEHTHLSAEQKLTELGKLLFERERESERLKAIDRRIAELVGIVDESRTRKIKPMSPKDFRRGVGL